VRRQVTRSRTSTPRPRQGVPKQGIMRQLLGHPHTTCSEARVAHGVGLRVLPLSAQDISFGLAMADQPDGLRGAAHLPHGVKGGQRARVAQCCRANLGFLSIGGSDCLRATFAGAIPAVDRRLPTAVDSTDSKIGAVPKG
jgi:hypothetical protein